jgi:hypothetical protein
MEGFDRPNELVLGGTFMRQNNVIFDMNKDLLGFARAACNSDPSQIIDADDIITNPKGQRYVNDLSQAMTALRSRFS